LRRLPRRLLLNPQPEHPLLRPLMILQKLHPPYPHPRALVRLPHRIQPRLQRITAPLRLRAQETLLAMEASARAAQAAATDSKVAPAEPLREAVDARFNKLG